MPKKQTRDKRGGGRTERQSPRDDLITTVLKGSICLNQTTHINMSALMQKFTSALPIVSYETHNVSRAHTHTELSLARPLESAIYTSSLSPKLSHGLGVYSEFGK